MTPWVWLIRSILDLSQMLHQLSSLVHLNRRILLMKVIGLDRVLAKTIILLGKIQLEKNYLCGQMLKDFWCKTMKGLNKQCSLASILAKSFSNQEARFISSMIRILSNLLLLMAWEALWLIWETDRSLIPKKREHSMKFQILEQVNLILLPIQI